MPIGVLLIGTPGNDSLGSSTYTGDDAIYGLGGDDELRYNAGGILMGDGDGDAVADFHIQLQGAPALAAAELIL